MVSSTADSLYNDSHRRTENLYILTAHPQTGRLQSNSKPSRLLPSQDGQQPKLQNKAHCSQDNGQPCISLKREGEQNQ